METRQEPRVGAGAISGHSRGRSDLDPWEQSRLPAHRAIGFCVAASLVAWVVLLGAAMWLWRAWP